MTPASRPSDNIYEAFTATRRTSTSWIVTPGAAQEVAGGTDACAWSSVANTTIENPLPSRGSSQYPATKPGAEVILGRMSLVRASAAAEA
jgi:hypothetical protein